MDREKLKRKHSKRLLAFPIAAGIILIFTLLWHVGYNRTVNTINTVQVILTNAPSDIPQDIPWLAQLTVLRNILEYINQPKLLKYRWIGLTQTYRIYQTTKTQYSDLLHAQFVPYLKSNLLNQIQLGLKGNKLALFSALKAYLTITSPSHYDKNVILSWYRTYWKLSYPNNAVLRRQLQHHLLFLIESNATLWEQDHALVQQAQKALRKLPLFDLAFLELQGEYEPVNVPIFPGGKMPGISLKNASVPSFFSGEHFKEIYNKKIPHIGNILAKGNWVLGTQKGTVISSKEQGVLTQNIRKYYLKFYTSAWAETISHVRLTPETTIPKTLTAIQQINDSKSPLMQLIKIILGNASLDGGATVKANKKLLAVKEFLYKKNKRALITKPLIALQTYLQKINNAKNIEKASYMASTHRFRTNGAHDPITAMLQRASSTPEPIKSWMTTIANSGWKALLIHSKSHLNSVWRTLVLPIYLNEIRGRYPVFDDSRENISLKNFNDFFGPNGTIGAFYIYYLQPFVNMETSYWTLKKLNGEDIGVSRNALNMFIRASLIQQMFFTDNANKPSFRFALTPISLSSNLLKVTINFGGQIYNVYSQTKRSKAFFWPSVDASFVSVIFTTNDSKTRTINIRGPWALFRLIDNSTLQPSGNPKKYTTLLTSDDDTAKFTLTLEHRVNPFVPGVIAKYRAPDKL